MTQFVYDNIIWVVTDIVTLPLAIKHNKGPLGKAHTYVITN